MARIRTIKPSFWLHDDLSALPEATHLLAAALLNHADDEGFFNANPGLIRAACSPLREPSVPLQDSLEALVEIGYLRIGQAADGKRYGHVVGFLEHQRVSRPTPSKIGRMAIRWQSSPTIHAPLAEHSETTAKDFSASSAEDLKPVNEQLLLEGKGTERKGEDVQAAPVVAPGTVAAQLECPHSEIVALYHAALPSNPKLKVWAGKREAALRARWREDPQRQSLDYWRRLFDYVARSSFLTGRCAGSNGRPFLPGLDWLVQPENFAKLIEGRYHQGSSL